ncbi:MAG: peptide-methionine (R)-S-oxide reductase MsrB [Roseibacillus sp.]
MTTKTLLTSLALGLTFAVGGLFLSEQAWADKEPVMEVVTEKPTEPTKNIVKSDEEWKKELTPEQYRILREAGTERAFGKVYKEFKEQGAGTYICVGCNTELFSSNEKFDSQCGWPSFYDPSKNENVKAVPDVSGGMVRTEVRCAKCDGHLGHIFEGEGFDTPTDQRYCINGSVLRFVPHEVHEKEAEPKVEKKEDAAEKK